jgi:hypothetical protein
LKNASEISFNALFYQQKTGLSRGSDAARPLLPQSVSGVIRRRASDV